MDLNNVHFDWLDSIPKDWELKKVKHLFVQKKNRTDNPEGIPILSLTMKGIVERDISTNEGQLPDTYSGYNLIEEGDVVFNPMDLISGWVDYSHINGLISPSYKVIEPKSNEVDSKYFTYYFQILYTEKILFPFGEGVHYQYRWGLGTSTLDNFPVPFPPLSEQQQIVSFLDTKTSLIDTLIEKTQRKIKLLQEKKTSLINEVVTKGLNPNVEMKDSGVEWIGEIPSHWTRNKLNRITDRIGDGLHSTPKYVDSSEYYFINGNNLVNGEIKIFDSTKCVSEEEFKKHFIQLNSKTLLLSINGTIGNLSFYNGEKVILGKSSCYINLNQNINHHFVFYVLKSESISKYFTFELTGTTIFNLSLNSIRNTPIVVPPENEQQQIVEYLDEQTQLIDKTISIEEKRIELLKEYRQSLISEVVTGKLKVTTDGHEIH